MEAQEVLPQEGVLFVEAGLCLLEFLFEVGELAEVGVVLVQEALVGFEVGVGGFVVGQGFVV